MVLEKLDEFGPQLGYSYSIGDRCSAHQLSGFLRWKRVRKVGHKDSESVPAVGIRVGDEGVCVSVRPQTLLDPR
jgi:hypothetical protein